MNACLGSNPWIPMGLFERSQRKVKKSENGLLAHGTDGSAFMSSKWVPLSWVLTVTLLAACAPSSGPTPGMTPKTLAQNDIEALSKLDADSAQKRLLQFDRENEGVFTDIFGGTQSPHIRDFLGHRIRYIFDSSELKNAVISPSHLSYTDWTRDSDDSDAPSPPSDDVLTMASNIGTLLWLHGAVNGTKLTLFVPDESRRASVAIPIASSRVGIIMLGPGYSESMSLRDGETVSLPPEYRQSTLIHEARHSDCVGGLSQKQIHSIRQARDIHEFEKVFNERDCGHLHSICPKGHDFEGIAACDKHPWGAYAVGAIYSDAMAQVSFGMDKALLEADALDSYSRLLFERNALLKRRLGNPDMSSKGVLTSPALRQ